MNYGRIAVLPITGHDSTTDLLPGYNGFLRNGWYIENYTGNLPVILEHGLIGAAGDGLISAAARADFAGPRPLWWRARDTRTGCTSWAGRRSP